MPAVPWHYAICNELFEGWPLERVAATAGALGYQGIELAPYTLCRHVADLTAADRRGIRAAVESAGLRVAGLHWLLAQTEGLGANDPDAAVRRRTVDYLLAEVDLCADLSGQALVFGSPAQPRPRRGRGGRLGLDGRGALRRCGERAAERGVFFCLEALPGPECCFITDVDAAATLVRTVDRPGLQMMVDVKAMAADPRPIPEQIAPWRR